MSFKDSPEWQLGDIAVEAVRKFHVAHGSYVLRTDLIEEGGAPCFVGPNGKIAVPDLLATSKGRSRWREVKWKTSCVLHQRTRTWRHGIDAANWRYYLWVQNITSIPGWLDIVQLRPGPEADPDPVLLTAPFDLLCAHVEPHDGGGDVKVWWDLDVFRWYPLRNLDGNWQTVDIGPRLVRPWEGKSKAGVAPRWEPS